VEPHGEPRSANGGKANGDEKDLKRRLKPKAAAGALILRSSKNTVRKGPGGPQSPREIPETAKSDRKVAPTKVRACLAEKACALAQAK
jgi:hypothetical protein